MPKTLVGEMIETWLKERPFRSLVGLSQLTGISEGNLKRLKNSPQIPELHTLCILGVKTGQRDLADRAIAENYPESIEYFRSAWTGVEAPPKDDLDPSEFFETPDAIRIFISLFTHKGLSRAQVQESFGESGSRILNRLVEKGFGVAQDDDRVVPCEKWFSYRGPSDVTRVIRLLSYLFDQQEIGKGSPFSRIGVLTQSVTEETGRRVQAAVQDAALEVKALLDDPKNAGETVIAVSMMMQPIK
jgi:hypothetical protein